MTERDDLRTVLLDLTEPRPEPPDPAALVLRRVQRHRHRRRGATIAVAAVVTGAVLAGVPALDRLGRDTEPGVAGPPVSTTTVAPPPTAAPQPSVTPTSNVPAQNRRLPAPWKDKTFTKFPERNLYAPQGIYLAEGELAGHRWHAVTHTGNTLSEGCIDVTSDDPAAPELGFSGCFDDWPAGRVIDYSVNQAFTGHKPDLKAIATFVGGAVSEQARSVRIRTADGQVRTTPAIGTPTSDQLRFFLVLLPGSTARVTEVTPLDAAGRLAGPPTGLPAEGGQCYKGPREGHPDGISVCATASKAPTTPVS